MVRCPRPGCKGTLVASWGGTCSLCGRSLDMPMIPLPLKEGRVYRQPQVVASQDIIYLPRWVMLKGSGHVAHLLLSEELKGEPAIFWAMACGKWFPLQDIRDAQVGQKQCFNCVQRSPL